MDSMGKVMVAGVIASTIAMVVKTITSAVVRHAELHRRDVAVDARSIQERLERIEIAVDTIAIEVERLGEHHRFNAQLALNRPDPLPSRVVTPH